MLKRYYSNASVVLIINVSATQRLYPRRHVFNFQESIFIRGDLVLKGTVKYESLKHSVYFQIGMRKIKRNVKRWDVLI